MGNILKKLIISILIVSNLDASDPIMLDSIFENAKGLRSNTSIDILTSSGTRKFTSYPRLLSYDDGTIIDETKQVLLNQSFMSEYNSNLDLLFSFNAYYRNITYIEQNGIDEKSSTSFDSIWMGAKYSFDTRLYEFKQSIILQTALMQNMEYKNSEERFNLKSYYLQYNLQHFSDPLISSIYFATTQNLDRKINDINVALPDSYSLGLDLFLILNPNISLNFNFEENYQTAMKEEEQRVNSSTILSTMGFGVTYNLNENNSLSINSHIGTSSNAPDSRVTISLWHKF